MTWIKDIPLTLVASVIGLSGVILGFMLNASFTWFREDRASRKQTIAVRKLLKLEMAHNISLLFLMADGETTLEGLQGSPLDLALPEWNKTAFTSLMPSLTMHLDDASIAAVYRFYSKLDRITALLGRGGCIEELKEKLSERLDALYEMAAMQAQLKSLPDEHPDIGMLETRLHYADRKNETEVAKFEAYLKLAGFELQQLYKELRIEGNLLS